MQQIYLVFWAFLSAFVMYRELLLLAGYEYKHRQSSLGNEAYYIRTTPITPHLLYWREQAANCLCDSRNWNTYHCPW